MTSTRPPGAPTDLAVGYGCTHPGCRRVTNLLNVADGQNADPQRTGWYGHGTTFIEIRRMA